MIRHGRPAVLLPHWALAAEPEDLLVAVQAGVVREVPVGCVALMVPFCQARLASRVLTLCKGWVPNMIFAPFIFVTLWTASFVFADPLVG